MSVPLTFCTECGCQECPSIVVRFQPVGAYCARCAYCGAHTGWYSNEEDACIAWNLGDLQKEGDE